MAFNAPTGIAFYTEDEVRGDDLVATARRIAVFLEGFICTLGPLRTFHDWWQHDGLHFEQARITFAEALALITTPQTMVEATPDDDDVCFGIAPEECDWYLRFRAERDETYGEYIGALGVVMPHDAAAVFKAEVLPRCEATLVETPSETYYASVRS
jgi:hypothetical protein